MHLIGNYVRVHAIHSDENMNGAAKVTSCRRNLFDELVDVLNYLFEYQEKGIRNEWFTNINRVDIYDKWHI